MENGRQLNVKNFYRHFCIFQVCEKLLKCAWDTHTHTRTHTHTHTYTHTHMVDAHMRMCTAW